MRFEREVKAQPFPGEITPPTEALGLAWTFCFSCKELLDVNRSRHFYLELVSFQEKKQNRNPLEDFKNIKHNLSETKFL